MSHPAPSPQASPEPHSPPFTGSLASRQPSEGSAAHTAPTSDRRRTPSGWKYLLSRFNKRFLGLYERAANPHAEPVNLDHLRRSLSFLLGWIATRGGKVNPTYPMLLSNNKDVIDCALRLIALQSSGWLEHPSDHPQEIGEYLEQLKELGTLNVDDPRPTPGAQVMPPVVLDVEAALRIALLDCEARTKPVTANTLQSVEDSEYPGYWRRKRRRLWLMIWTLLALILAITGEAIMRDPDRLPFFGPDGQYALGALRYFMWGVVGAGLYLLRRMYSFVEKRLFDPAMFGIYSVRLLMGGIAGMLIAGTILPGFALAKEDPLYMSAVAVLSGYGVRVVFAVFEALIEGVSERIRGQQPHA